MEKIDVVINTVLYNALLNNSTVTVNKQYGISEEEQIALVQYIAAPLVLDTAVHEEDDCLHAEEAIRFWRSPHCTDCAQYINDPLVIPEEAHGFCLKKKKFVSVHDACNLFNTATCASCANNMSGTCQTLQMPCVSLRLCQAYEKRT